MSKSKLNYGVYNGKVIKKMLENSRIYFFAALFAAGIFLGAFLLKSDTYLSTKIISLAEQFSFSRNQQGITDNFIDSLAVNLLFNGLSLFLAFSLVGYPLLIWMPFFRGMGLGALSGYLYSAYKLMGLGYCALTVYPSAVISTFAFILSCNDCCEYSKNAFAKAIKGRGQFEKDETKILLTRQIIFAGIYAVSSIIDALFGALFRGLFEI